MPEGGGAAETGRPGPARLRALGRWLRRWGISLASLGGGILTLFVFRREVRNVGWIVGYLVLLWLLFALVTQIRQAFAASERRSRRLVVTAVDYTIQTLYHGLLLFLIPAYFASTTFTSANGVFTAGLVALALLATFDPWYRAIVHPRPWVNYVFFLVSTFGALNLALPLVGVPPHLALLGGAWLSVAGLAPAISRVLGWRQGLGLAASVGVMAAVVVHAGRAAVPPVPLSLARAAIVWDIGSLASVEPMPGAVPAGELHRQGLRAQTAIYAPAGLTQPVRHVWRHGGEVVDVIELSPVRGGRREGFRTFSRKTAFPADPRGPWSVDVVTAGGQLIGRLAFTVVP